MIVVTLSPMSARVGASLVSLLAIGFGLIGCAQPLPKPPLERHHSRGVQPGGIDPVMERVSSPATAGLPSTVSPTPKPVGVLTLREVLALVLQHNPELAAFSWEVRIREAETLQAGLRPNPELDVEVENVAGSGDFRGFDGSETTVQLGQLIELAGKRAKRRRVAAVAQDLGVLDYERQRIAVFTEAAQAFVDVYAAQEALSLAKELLRLAEESLAAVGSQVRAGATSVVERLRAEVAASTARVERRQAEANLSATRVRLAATWGASEARFASVVGDLHVVRPPPEFSSIASRISQNPDLALWAQEVELREAVVALEDARRVPDVTASGGFRRLRETDDTALVFGFSVPLPLFDRNQGTRLAARRSLSKAREERRAVGVRARAALRASYEALRASFDEIEALRSRVLPKAESAYRGVREGYLRGLFRYVEVLDAQRTLFELRAREIEGLRSYHATVSELERLIGAPLWVDGADDRGPSNGR